MPCGRQQLTIDILILHSLMSSWILIITHNNKLFTKAVICMQVESYVSFAGHIYTCVKNL